MSEQPARRGHRSPLYVDRAEPQLNATLGSCPSRPFGHSRGGAPLSPGACESDTKGMHMRRRYPSACCSAWSPRRRRPSSGRGSRRRARTITSSSGCGSGSRSRASSSAATRSTSVNPAGVDFVQEFDITEKKFNEFRGVLRGGKNALRVAHVDMGYNEAARLQRTIEFGGRVFTVNAPATADLAVGPVAHRLRARLRQDRPRPVRRHRRGRLQPRRRRPPGHHRVDHGERR